MDPEHVTHEDAERIQQSFKDAEQAFYRFINGTPKSALENYKRLDKKAEKVTDIMDEIDEREEDDGEA